MSSTLTLNPLANPFAPKTLFHHSPSASECPFSVIYCNGVPTGLVNEHETISNIPDETIDEVFPPSAEDAAELDALDDFLQVMVDLSFIEDREEKGRIDLARVTPKRWEAKRKDGLKGKPHLPYGRVERVFHESNKVKNENRILPLHGRHVLHGTYVNRDMICMQSNNHLFYRNINRHVSNRLSKPIQQPRKQN